VHAAAQRLSRRHAPQVRVLNYSGSGIETTFTEGEDACLASMVPEMPAPAAGAGRSLLVVGTLADIVEDQLRRLLEAMGIGAVQFLPPRLSVALPAVGPETSYLLAQPFLTATAKALDARGARHIEAPFPIGVEGTTRWLHAAAADWGIAEARFRDAIAPAQARARESLTPFRFQLADKRVFLFPDSQLELPLARFLSRELGMELTEVGSPYINRRLLGEELQLLPPGTRITEGQNVEEQLERCIAIRPDLVVCGLGLANPLEARGVATKWSIELVFSPIQGYEQAADLAELFARPLRRHQRLAV
jgi:light-independent protochlorophyllide reductase subunit N